MGLSEKGLRDLRLNTIPIIWLLIREINPVAGILFLRKSLSEKGLSEKLRFRDLTLKKINLQGKLKINFQMP